jgi:hypothetical protein
MKGLNTIVNPIKISEGGQLVVARHERRMFTEYNSVLGEPQFGSPIPYLMYEEATEGLARETLREVERILLNDTEILLEDLEVRLVPIADNGIENMLLEINYNFRLIIQPTEKINVRFFRIAEL